MFGWQTLLAFLNIIECSDDPVVIYLLFSTVVHKIQAIVYQLMRSSIHESGTNGYIALGIQIQIGISRLARAIFKFLNSCGE